MTEGAVISEGPVMHESYGGETVIDGGVIEDAVAPMPEGSSMRGASRTDAGILTVSVPEGANVVINGLKTKSDGASRRYVSHGLKPGHEYRYEVVATMDRDGRTVTETKTALMKAGSESTLTFDLASPTETSLTLNVPAGADVFLSGNATKSTGTVRRFATTRLTKGEKWGDYVVQVRLNRDGRTITKERSVTLVGGDAKTLDFDFADNRLADAR